MGNRSLSRWRSIKSGKAKPRGGMAFVLFSTQNINSIPRIVHLSSNTQERTIRSPNLMLDHEETHRSSATTGKMAPRPSCNWQYPKSERMPSRRVSKVSTPTIPETRKGRWRTKDSAQCGEKESFGLALRACHRRGKRVLATAARSNRREYSAVTMKKNQRLKKIGWSRSSCHRRDSRGDLKPARNEY
jgi:hypothetical protein